MSLYNEDDNLVLSLDNSVVKFESYTQLYAVIF